MRPAGDLVERFRADLDGLIESGTPIGVAVSGGPDSIALLLLAAAERPGLIKAATVDHGLRPESVKEAADVAALCAKIGVPHQILPLNWSLKPKTGLQKKAREGRYRILGDWAKKAGLTVVLTGHQLDDQAETFVMRIARGVGVNGLAGMRGASPLPGHPEIRLLRPLLGWRRSELDSICAAAGVVPADDPSNQDRKFERVRVRKALASAELFDPEAIARSATVLGQADAALDWATDRAWAENARASDAGIVIRVQGIPAEIRRRMVRRAVRMLAREGHANDLRGRELDHLLASLRGGGKATLRGVLCDGGDGETWSFIPAPNRTRRRANFG